MLKYLFILLQCLRDGFNQLRSNNIRQYYYYIGPSKRKLSCPNITF